MVSEIERNGGKAAFVRLDVTSERDGAAAIETVVSTFGKLAILINDAGIALGDTDRDMLIAGTPMGRLGRADEMAALIAFVASDDATSQPAPSSSPTAASQPAGFSPSRDEDVAGRIQGPGLWRRRRLSPAPFERRTSCM